VTPRLTQKQVEWIARGSGRLTSRDAGRTVGVGGRRARQTRTEHRRTGRVPVLGRPGRKKKEIPPHVVRKVLWARRTYRVGATAIKAILGIPDLSHHTIHMILEERGMVNRMGRRARRVPWAGFEREYSNPVWHTDRAVLPDGRWPVANGKDASRFIIGYGIFERATSANAVSVLRKFPAGRSRAAARARNLRLACTGRAPHTVT